MSRYDERGSLAPRDIVARAIDNEMKTRGDDYVFLDATHLDKQLLREHFPNIYDKCLSIGLDITRDMIPVVPAAHYMCGGIKVDMDGRTWINNLYAAGETASTGLHGANRLASNSLIEAIVYADRAAKAAVKDLDRIKFQEHIPDWDYAGTSHPEEMVLITQNHKEMQQIMSNYVGIVRSDLRLKRALDRLEIIYMETEELYRKSTLSKKLCELRNLINAGYLTIKMAQDRKESRGLHYNTDYPSKKEMLETS
jgi:L-aspartate oxidase